MGRNREGFDYFPVIDAAQGERERIIGLINLVPYLRGKAQEGIVQEQIDPLSEDNLIGANAGILTFVKTADRVGCRLVMSSADISGLLNLSDLQRLPVRAALFALITNLEMTMEAAIRREFTAPDKWKKLLSEDRLHEINRKRKAAEAADNLVDDLLLTGFADKSNIIRRSPSFPEAWGAFESEMTEARELRNNLAHANEYAATRDAAAKVCNTVRNIEHWIAHLTAWPSTQTRGGD